MNFYEMPILKNLFDEIAEPFFCYSFPSKVTKYACGDVILFEEFDVVDKMCFITGRLVITIIVDAVKDCVDGNLVTHCRCKVLRYLNNTYLAGL